MKYGILTYHNIPNFGSVLQAYALCNVVRSFGYDCDIIDYSCENIIKRECEYHSTGNVIRDILARLFKWPHTVKKSLACREFIRPYCTATKYDRSNIGSVNNVYDGFISGSDIIWNLDISDDNNFFLDFCGGGVKRIAYAASVGDTWDEEELFYIRRALSEYDYLSTREADTCDFINDELGMKCDIVADPTMLIPSEEWSRLLVDIPDKNYVLVYFPNNELLNAAKRYCAKNQYQLIVLETRLPFRRHNRRILYSPDVWMSYVKNAKAVFTNSYHGFLFALYYHRPVWTNTYSNRQRSVIDRLGLIHCHIDHDPELENIIDYDECDKALAQFRQSSLDLLKAALRE